MNSVDIKRLVQLVAGLCEAFNRTPSQATFMAYEIGLEDLPIESIEVAVKRALRESRFMPSPAELRELGGESTSQDRATLAWDAVLKAVHLGPYKHVSFVDDRIINATIRNLGGWPSFLTRFSSAENEKWLRKDFIDTYRTLHHSQVDGDMCRPLVGLAGGAFPDGREYVPRITEVRTNLPALPAPMRAQQTIVNGKPLLVLKRVPRE
jgi:hypothetical protein